MIDSIGASRRTEEKARIIEGHVHNREYTFGKLAIQTATNWGERAGLTPYRAISGAADFGTDPNDEAQVIGSADTPVRPGSLSFDLHVYSIVDVQNATVFVLRIIHGTGTMADAETAGQYTEMHVQQQTAAGQNKPQEITHERIPVGEKVWVRVKNATNNAWVDFLVRLHEYPAPA